MLGQVRCGLAMALAAWLAVQPARPAEPANETAILQIRILGGDGTVHTAGSRSQRALAVLITDETGRPVEAAAVGFRLPEEGVSGTFSTGLKTDLVVTGPDGRADATGVQWSRATGPFQMRVTAAKGEARAGVLVSQYVSETSPGTIKPQALLPAAAPFTSISKHSYSKWLIITSLVAGAAAGGLAATLGGGGGAKKQPAPAAASPAPPPPSVVIGTPSISVGNR